MIDIDKLLEFNKLMAKFRDVERVVLIKDSDRYENDQEHSYNLAMLAWYIISTHKLSLNTEKVMKYCLCHDLVEAYAGDTFFYEKGRDEAEKQKREEEAASRIAKEFPELKELHENIKSYESKKDNESRFVYALDKLEPILNIYIDKGRTWRKENVTLEMLKTKKKKVGIDPVVDKYFDEIIELIEKESGMFPTN